MFSQYLSSTNFPAWRDAVHLLVLTNKVPEQVEVTLFIEKPRDRDIYWAVYLHLYEGTNDVARLDLGYKLLGRGFFDIVGVKSAGVKAVQKFILSVSSNALQQSTLTFTQTERPPPETRWHPFYGGTAPTIVHLSDVWKGATDGFRPGKPIFPSRPPEGQN